MCGKRLVAAIPEWLPHYEKTYRSLSTGIRKTILSASGATLDRQLKPIRMTTEKGLGGTKDRKFNVTVQSIESRIVIFADKISVCGVTQIKKLTTRVAAIYLISQV